jgi:DNA-binding transcriptional LysR family regulator
MEVNLRSIDLNLLVVLEALLEEAHVSRAATRLGLSQPAASAALERCRILFDDPLLERSGSTMRLTTTAEALRRPLRDAVASVAEVLGHRQQCLETAERTVRIVMADVLATLCLPALCDAVAVRAPGVSIVLCPWEGGVAGLDLVERGSADVAVSTFHDPFDPDRFHIRNALEQGYVVAMAEMHPAAVDFDLDRWIEWPHIVVSSGAGTHAVLDETLAGLGRSRKVGLSLPSFLLVPEILRGCRMIGMLPSLCVRGELGRGLAIFPPPIPIPGFTLKLARHRRHDSDAVVRFICEALAVVIAKLATASAHNHSR